MLKATSFAVVVLLCMVAGTVARCCTPGSTAPDFELQDLTNGQPIRLSDNFDRPTVLVFWVSWCTHCRQELPVIQRLHEQFGENRANFIGVSLDAKPEDALRAIEEASATFRNGYLDVSSDSRIVSDYQIAAVPLTIIIEREGTIRSRYQGTMSESMLREELSLLGVE